MPTLDLTCAQTLSHISGCFFYSTPRSASGHTHTHTSCCVLEICLMMTHTYTHPYSRLIALHNTHFSLTFTGAFPLHACGVTRNWRTYFISGRRVFLVETIVLQTVLWDIRAWSACNILLGSWQTEIANKFYMLIMCWCKKRCQYVKFIGKSP